MSLLKNLLIIGLFVSVYVAVSPAFANTDYCAAGVARYTNTSWSWASLGMASNDTKTTTAMKFGTTLVSNYFLDSPEVGLTFFGS